MQFGEREESENASGWWLIRQQCIKRRRGEFLYFHNIFKDWFMITTTSAGVKINKCVWVINSFFKHFTPFSMYVYTQINWLRRLFLYFADDSRLHSVRLLLAGIAWFHWNYNESSHREENYIQKKIDWYSLRIEIGLKWKHRRERGKKNYFSDQTEIISVKLIGFFSLCSKSYKRNFIIKMH